MGGTKDADYYRLETVSLEGVSLEGPHVLSQAIIDRPLGASSIYC